MNAPSTPGDLLGLAPGASVAEARAARRRLAKQFHPDLGPPSSGAAMVLVNRAVAAVEAAQAALREGVEAEPDSSAGGTGPEVEALEDDSFSIAALPVDAFEALFLAAYGLGEILVADEPYTLELYLAEPLACFCALSLVPEGRWQHRHHRSGRRRGVDAAPGGRRSRPPDRRAGSTVATGGDPRSQQTHRPGQG